METEITEEKVTFKSSKKRNLRKRRISEDEKDDSDSAAPNETMAKLNETKERQKLRNKPNGVNLIGLALGKKITLEDEVTTRDPFKMRSGGGMINMHALKSGKNVVKQDDSYDVSIGTQFSAETNKRDEDEEMMKYIEEELSKRKGNRIDTNNDDNNELSIKYLSPEEAALLALPDHLRLSSTQRSEEMLSNQMLNGIPEVDLGIEAKIKNIEATEEAKEKLLQEQKNKSDGPSHFVPTNMAVNFVQHNRFNIEEAELKRQKQRQLQHQQQQQQQQQEARNVAEHNHNNHQQHHNNHHNHRDKGVKKATDDYHYDKFKKQFRRY